MPKTPTRYTKRFFVFFFLLEQPSPLAWALWNQKDSGACQTFWKEPLPDMRYQNPVSRVWLDSFHPYKVLNKNSAVWYIKWIIKLSNEHWSPVTFFSVQFPKRYHKNSLYDPFGGLTPFEVLKLLLKLPKCSLSFLYGNSPSPEVKTPSSQDFPWKHPNLNILLPPNSYTFSNFSLGWKKKLPGETTIT